MDSLAEKYYSISPYAYCGGNPVKYIDPTGMKVETGSMTKEEQEEYDKMIKHLCESKMFNTLYSTLVKSDNVYNISFGQTEKNKSGESVLGNFKPDSKTDGGSVTFLKGSNLNGSATTEEPAHAYQNENKTLDNTNINPEFEADFAPFQPTKQEAVKGVDTYQFSHSKDWFAGNKKIKYAEYENTSTDNRQTHNITDFTNQIKNLPEGKYKIVDGKIVPN